MRKTRKKETKPRNKSLKSVLCYLCKEPIFIVRDTGFNKCDSCVLKRQMDTRKDISEEETKKVLYVIE